MAKIDTKQAIREMTLILMYLTRFQEEGRAWPGYPKQDLAWKGYDFNVINDLEAEKLIGRPPSVQACGSDRQGLERSRALLERYNVLDWDQAPDRGVTRES
jgi:hypothetical protein